MKKLLIGSVVAVLCTGASAVYADDAHHPEQGSAPASKPAAGKNVLPKQPATPDKSMGNAEGGGVTDAQMAKAQERMKQAQVLMGKLREAKNPAERKKLMREHTQAMHDTMGMMRGMKMGMMDGCQGMGMMGGGQGMGMMMDMHRMMEERMGMMQMMMEQMLDRQEMLMQDGK